MATGANAGPQALRVAIFSDIHGNVRGLDACLDDLRAQGGADVIVGAGDFCMDGPRPLEVLQRLQELGARCVRGNTDRYIAFEDHETFERSERAAIRWQRKRLGAQALEWLRALPARLELGPPENGLLVVHASPRSDEEHVWPQADEAQLEGIFDGVAAKVIAFGHLHVPYVRMWRDRMLVNVSSAGLPKDGDPRACYAILTERSGGWEVKHRRVEFDVEEVAHELELSGIPQLKKRLEVLRRARYKQLSEVIP